MPKYRVHVYTVVRMVQPPLDAAGPVEALTLATEDLPDLHHHFQITNSRGKEQFGLEQEWVEEHQEYLVDELDEEGSVVNGGGDGDYYADQACGWVHMCRQLLRLVEDNDSLTINECRQIIQAARERLERLF